MNLNVNEIERRVERLDLNQKLADFRIGPLFGMHESSFVYGPIWPKTIMYGPINININLMSRCWVLGLFTFFYVFIINCICSATKKKPIIVNLLNFFLPNFENFGLKFSIIWTLELLSFINLTNYLFNYINFFK